ncbi:hypothetical protein GUJ93_ZPchr0008g14183 [Zizania palustris]|uniref:Uncharacterized protein n=1 Tax=Zizania palustris TaxID=103762 RepID=A0A8J5VIT0_ZIZPA|nr:hypothetical protein GUJ93_ZPchr0008g14183 [Zizania palustris]
MTHEHGAPQQATVTAFGGGHDEPVMPCLRLRRWSIVYLRRVGGTVYKREPQLSLLHSLSNSRIVHWCSVDSKILLRLGGRAERAGLMSCTVVSSGAQAESGVQIQRKRGFLTEWYRLASPSLQTAEAQCKLAHLDSGVA